MHSIEWSRQVFRGEIGRELEEVFDGFDTDADGQLDFDEFMKLTKILC